MQKQDRQGTKVIVGDEIIFREDDPFETRGDLPREPLSRERMKELRKQLKNLKKFKTTKFTNVTFIDIDEMGTIKTMPLHRYMKYRGKYPQEFLDPLIHEPKCFQILERLLRNCPIGNCSLK